ncbi:hypothetical protein EON71_01285 [bacterium]|nr:MAG: hypothetical protein EON71_01285 [bacterium]
MNQYPEDFESSETIIKSEVVFWKKKWCTADDLQTNFVDAPSRCNEYMYPNIFIMLCASMPFPWLLQNVLFEHKNILKHIYEI